MPAIISEKSDGHITKILHIYVHYSVGHWSYNMASAYVSISRGMDRENVVYTTVLLKSREPRHTYLLVSGPNSRSKPEPFLTLKFPPQITLKGIGEFYFLVF